MNIIFNTLNILLRDLFNFTGDWGITIILLTLIVKLILLPISFKQRINMNRQQQMAGKLEDIKQQYKDNAEKLKTETEKFYAESTKNFLGCMVTLLQIPIIYTLYKVIVRIPAEAGTVIVPWMASIKIPDKYYILPVIYVLVSSLPYFLPSLPYLKTAYKVRMTKSSLISTIVFSLMIVIKAPVGIGMYFISTSLFSLLEEIAFRIYMRRNRNICVKA